MMTALGMGALAMALVFFALLGVFGLLGVWVTATERNWSQFASAAVTAVISIWLAASCGFYLDALTK